MSVRFPRGDSVAHNALDIAHNRTRSPLPFAALLLVAIAIFVAGSVGAAAVVAPNVIVTNEAAGVQVEGSFARIEAAQSRSATVLQSVGGGAHRVRFVADPGVRGYYRVLLWWPQAGR